MAFIGNVAETLFSPVKFSSGGEFAYQKWVIDIYIYIYIFNNTGNFSLKPLKLKLSNLLEWDRKDRAVLPPRIVFSISTAYDNTLGSLF